ncbi:MAG TPA: hypothetical protein VH413_06360 [Verrucomicrobiae bacterium]|jgi:hypothetical protein|nr:hypothetical protein [Verrucomicrobiae bacterium]
MKMLNELKPAMAAWFLLYDSGAALLRSKCDFKRLRLAVVVRQVLKV